MNRTPQTTEPAPVFLTIREVADRYRCSVASIARRAAAGTMPRGIKCAGSRLWPLKSLEAFERELESAQASE